MRQFRSLGSARGAASNGGPYRDWLSELCGWALRLLNEAELVQARDAADYSCAGMLIPGGG